MSGPFFQKQSWPPFVHQGTTYSLVHLEEYQIEVVDSQKLPRQIAVTFSDHCFTRAPEGGDDPMLHYPQSTRNVGYFCVERYQHSLNLSGYIAQATTQQVWHLGHNGFAIVPIVDHQGIKTLYGIVFSLDRVTGLPVELHMRIKSAHPRDERELVTFGQIRFAHLVTLRMQGKTPSRIMDKHRKRPRVT
jgi:hypothetical protein